MNRVCTACFREKDKVCRKISDFIVSLTAGGGGLTEGFRCLHLELFKVRLQTKPWMAHGNGMVAI